MSPPEGGWPSHWPPDAIAYIEELRWGFEARIAKLEAENAALREKIDELERARHRQASPFGRGKKGKRRKRPGRKPGPDHGPTAGRPPPDEVDETVEVPRPDACLDCGGSIEWEEGTRSQFQTDIPPVKPHTVEFKIPIGHCCRCRKRIQPRHPRQTSDALGAAGVHVGPTALGMAVYMNKMLGVPFAKISTFFGEVFSLRVATSTLVRATLRGSVELNPAYESLARDLADQSAVVHIDETGWRIAGKNCWLWVFVGEETTLFVIGDRSAEIPRLVLGEGWIGTMVHDGFLVYDVAAFKDAYHQTCNAHLIHRASQLEESVPGPAKRFPRGIKALLQEGLEFRPRSEREAIGEDRLAKARDRLEARLDRALDRRIEQPQTARFKRHLEKHRDQILHYLYDPEVPGTNNKAEQAIRPAVIARKRGGCSRSESGALAHATWTSLGCTVLQRGISALTTFVEVFQRSWTGLGTSSVMPGGP